MANSKTGRGSTNDNARYVGISVDTDPGASGYWSDETHARNHMGCVWLEITSIDSATVTIQFKAMGQSSWSTYPTTYTEVSSIKIESNPSTQWRVGVEDDNQGSGVTAQISW